jgi:hypothetical protein
LQNGISSALRPLLNLMPVVLDNTPFVKRQKLARPSPKYHSGCSSRAGQKLPLFSDSAYN